MWCMYEYEPIYKRATQSKINCTKSHYLVEWSSYCKCYKQKVRLMDVQYTLMCTVHLEWHSHLMHPSYVNLLLLCRRLFRLIFYSIEIVIHDRNIEQMKTWKKWSAAQIQNVQTRSIHFGFCFFFLYTKKCKLNAITEAQILIQSIRMRLW